MTETVHARNLSCQGLTAVDPDTLTHGGQPVEGYAEEMAQRTEDHVYGCELIGHGLPPVETAVAVEHEIAHSSSVDYPHGWEIDCACGWSETVTDGGEQHALEEYRKHRATS